jgi:hypothetical protein
VTCLTTSGRCTWVPPAAHLDTGRLGSAGSRGLLFPDVIVRMQPSDSLPPSATAPVPLAGGLPRGGRFFCALKADDTCARQRAVRRRRVPGSPQNRTVVEERRGPPRVRGHPLRTCGGRTPRRISSPPRPSVAGDHCGLRVFQHARHPGRLEVSGPQSHGPHVHVPPHRRWHVGHRRKASDRPGSPFAGQVFHPLDDTQHFMEDVRPPIPIDPQGLVALEFLSSHA